VRKIPRELTVDTLNVITRLERAMATFYHACAETPGDARNFWLGLEQEELRHAQHLQRMTEIIADRPGQFEPNRTFNAAAIQTFMTYLESLIERVRANEIPRTDQHRLLSLARDLEQSLLESKCHELVKTQDAEYLALIRAVIADTVAHKSRIVTRLAVTPKPA
jgi:cytochrome P450